MVPPVARRRMRRELRAARDMAARYAPAGWPAAEKVPFDPPGRRSRVDGGPVSLLVGAMAPALVVLAAGMGSRYGGLKQVDPVGPAGETVLDYAVFDALRAGFGRVVFVIRRDFEA